MNLKLKLVRSRGKGVKMSIRICARLSRNTDEIRRFSIARRVLIVVFMFLVRGPEVDSYFEND